MDSKETQTGSSKRKNVTHSPNFRGGFQTITEHNSKTRIRSNINGRFTYKVSTSHNGTAGLSSLGRESLSR